MITTIFKLIRKSFIIKIHGLLHSEKSQHIKLIGLSEQILLTVHRYTLCDNFAQRFFYLFNIGLIQYYIAGEVELDVCGLDFQENNKKCL